MSVFLAALAVGYAVGGRVADRWPSPAAFAAILFLAGFLVVPIAPIAARELPAVALGPRAGPLVASLLLFFPPAAVLGMVSPFAIRLRAREVATLGNVSGALYAVSTLGGIAGTLLASFVLLAAMSAQVSVHVLGATMLGLGLAFWAVHRQIRLAGGAALAAVLVVAAPVLGLPPLVSEGLRYERDTVYHRITVSDEGGVRYLKLDNYWQSGLDLTDRRRTVFAYTDFMHLPVLFNPQARRILMIGLGGGTVPTRYAEDYPHMQITVAELDPAVVGAARQYFAVPIGARIQVIPQDGRLFVTRATGRYDILLLDAYLIDTIPFHLATREFFVAAQAHLAPDGVLGSNVIGALDGPRSGLFRAIYKTVASVFPTVYVFPVDWGQFASPQMLRNIILVATDRPRLTPAQVLEAAARARRTPGVTLPQFEEVARALYDAPVRTDDVPVLTDDFAPVETLLQR